MLRTIARAIAAALAALPKMIVTVCRTTGRLLVSLIPSSAPPTTSAGLEADDLLMEVRQSREEDEALFKPTLAKTVYQYAAAVVANCTPPDISHLPLETQHWLEALEPAACRRLFHCTEAQIERHLAPQASGDHLEGIPSAAAWPPRKTPVLNGSKSANAEGERFVEGFWSDLLNNLRDEPQRA